MREELVWFANEMEIVLKQNDYKHPISTKALFKGMVDEVFELNREMATTNTTYPKYAPESKRRAIIKEAVDVANHAMMIANKMRDR